MQSRVPKAMEEAKAPSPRDHGETGNIYSRTKSMLEAVLNEPVNVKLAVFERPPFQFLHDVFMKVMRATGFGKGLYEGKELDGKYIRSALGKQGKLEFLAKLIRFLSLATGTVIEAKPSKIVRGIGAEQTMKMLQTLCVAAQERLFTSERCVQLVKRDIAKAREAAVPAARQEVTTKRGHKPRAGQFMGETEPAFRGMETSRRPMTAGPRLTSDRVVVHNAALAKLLGPSAEPRAGTAAAEATTAVGAREARRPATARLPRPASQPSTVSPTKGSLSPSRVQPQQPLPVAASFRSDDTFIPSYSGTGAGAGAGAGAGVGEGSGPVAAQASGAGDSPLSAASDASDRPGTASSRLLPSRRRRPRIDWDALARGPGEEEWSTPLAQLASRSAYGSPSQPSLPVAPSPLVAAAGLPLQRPSTSAGRPSTPSMEAIRPSSRAGDVWRRPLSAAPSRIGTAAGARVPPAATVTDPLLQSMTAAHTRAKEELLKAAEKGDIAIVDAILREGRASHIRRIVLPPPLLLRLEEGMGPGTAGAEFHGIGVVDANEPIAVGNHTCLHLASRNGHTSIVRLLLACGAAVDPRNDSEETPLHLAAYNGHVHVMECLCEAGADVNAGNEYNETPLCYAARRGHRPAVRRLLQWSADKTIEDRFGDVAFDHADNEGVEEELKRDDIQPVSEEASPLARLPVALVCRVWEMLDVPDVARCRSVCWLWRELLANEAEYTLVERQRGGKQWKKEYQEAIGFSPAPLSSMKFKPPKMKSGSSRQVVPPSPSSGAVPAVGIAASTMRSTVRLQAAGHSPPDDRDISGE